MLNEPLKLPGDQKVLVSALGALFFLSGTAALVYQVCWQRVLFAGLGSDTLSVATIVSVFMLGLSIGSLLGGWVADHMARPLHWFIGIELAIAIYGLSSIELIDEVMMQVGGMGHVAILIGAFFALVIPTTLMGMTLPVLVILLDRVVHSVGEATGSLYLANTMGAAVGAIGTGLYLFHVLDLRQATWLAAGINFMVSMGGWALVRKAST